MNKFPPSKSIFKFGLYPQTEIHPEYNYSGFLPL